MGLGIVGGGLGVAEWLCRQGAKIIITDLRDKKILAPSLKKLSKYPIKYILGQHRATDFKNVDLIIKNPAVPSESPYLKIARHNKVPILNDIELFQERWPGKIIALTGTKGKSTTAHLIYYILRWARRSVYLAGNVGQTPLSFLKPHNSPKDIMILELSSFQLENIFIQPDLALITNVFPDHLNRHKTMAKYTTIKANIFKNQRVGQVTILNYDNKISRQLASQTPSKLIFFSTQVTACPANCHLLFGIKNNKTIIIGQKFARPFCSLDKIKLLGQHNLENILAAVAVAYLSGVKQSVIQKAINNFTGVANRLELVRTINKVKYYNDTTATNPTATIAALTTLGQLKIKSQKSKVKNIILIGGGADKNLNFNELTREIKKTCKQVIMLCGTATPKFVQALKKVNYSTKNITEFNNFKKAIIFAKKSTKPGDIVLLSPGCASFGMFANEFDRGKQFVKAVNRL